jgi:hypothetical protein
MAAFAGWGQWSKVTRVYVIVEGSSEESFVNNVLAEVLWPRQVYATGIRLGTVGHRGGRTSYVRLRTDLIRQLKEDRSALCSTMVDFYGIGPGFPGTPLPQGVSNITKVESIDAAIHADIATSIPDLRADLRLIPYLSLHEYESLLFSDPDTFSRALSRPALAPHFHKVRNQFETPEDINDHVETSPSKRVLGIYPQYKKVIEGTQAARAIGITKMRAECPHFRQWAARLENLAG